MPLPAMTLPSDQPPQTPNNRLGSSGRSVVSQASRSTHSSNISAPEQELWISERLTVHGLLQDDDALDRYETFQKTVRDNVFSQCDSALRPQSAQHIMANLKLYRNDDEDTFLGIVLPTLINDTHLKKAKQDIQDATFSIATEVQDRVVDVKNLQDGETYIAQYWRQDGVVVGINKNLHKDLLPYAYPDPSLDKMLKKDRYDTMTTPRPDRVYGLSTSTLPIPSGIDKDAHVLLRVCSNQQHPFFIFEGKSNQGNHHGAQNQARRGGAELVYAARLLRTKLNMPEVSQGPDSHTYVYSCTITPDLLMLWVHWAEVMPQKTLYHMSRLKSFLLYDDKESFARIRLALHNILEWGCDLEARGLSKLHERLCEWQRSGNSAGGKTTGSSRKKKRMRTGGGEEAWMGARIDDTSQQVITLPSSIYYEEQCTSTSI